MNISSNVPENKKHFLEKLVNALGAVPNIQAVVLGGSYARGLQNENSDLDIGLYYFDNAPFDLAAIRQIAQDISLPQQPPHVTGFYEWGAWVNGGAWIHTKTGKVDFLYRSIDHVQRTIDESLRGISRHDYDQQPANGFYSVGYLAETSICVPLYDPQGYIQRLKQQVRVYPPLLKQTIIKDSLWSAEFTLMHARGFSGKGDVYSTTGCLNRAAANLLQVLFAINESYFLGDKKAIDLLGKFSLLPKGFVPELEAILAYPGGNPVEMQKSVARMEALHLAVTGLAQVTAKTSN